MHSARVGLAAALAAGVLVGAIALSGQVRKPANPQSPSTEQPSIKVSTRLVEVNVLVLDGQGKPVRGLTRDDFEVFDENEMQQIRAFSVESSGAQTAFGGAVKTALPANVFSNQRVPANAGTLSVILLDQLNTKIQDKLFAREQILRFLSQLRPNDRVAIYLLSDRLHVLHDFTSDSAALQRIVARQTGSAARQMGSAELTEETINEELLDAFMESSSRRIYNYAIRDRVKRTLSAVEWVARYLAPISGRKNLIWVSGGFPLTLGTDRRAGDTEFREVDFFMTETERAARAVNEANLAIYTIDARGLFTDPMDDNELRSEQPFFASRRGQPGGVDRTSELSNLSQTRQAGSGGSGGVSGPPRPRVPALPPSANSRGMRRLDETIDTMVMLADRTGGRAFYNSNDLATALRATLDESEVSYRLAFEPTHSKWDGEFRQIKVRVKRDGLHLRHRQGYMANPELKLDPKKELAALRESAASPLSFGDVGIRAELLDSPDPKKMMIRLSVKSSDLILQPDGPNKWKGSVDVYFETTNEAGAPLWSDGRRVAFALDSGLYQASLQNGVPMNKTLPRARDARQLRIAVRDVQTGAVGSLRIPLAEVN